VTGLGEDGGEGGTLVMEGFVDLHREFESGANLRAKSLEECWGGEVI
jgi:hypothetical protein